MKRTITMLIALWLCLFIFAGCDYDLSKNSNSQSTNDTVDTSEDVAIERVYVYEESDDVVKPSIILLGDNKCSFTFSALSSYSGIGTYTIEDNFFVLNTEDGVYTYTFKIEGEDMDRLIFVAEKSSDYLHQGQFEDGAVFEGKIVFSTTSNL